MLVLILHFIVEPGILNVKSPWLVKCLVLFRLSWSGVDLFFVLSGFLIGGILLDERHSGRYYRTFYARRFFRIVPLYAVLVATFAIGVYATPQTSGPLVELFNRRLPFWPYPLFLQNLAMTWYRNWGSAWMGATWSLAVEEQFYLMLPFVVRRLSRGAMWGFAAGMIVLAPLLRAVLQHSAWQHSATDGFAAYMLLPCRGDALGFGLLVAIACRNQTVWTWLISHRRYLYTAFAVLGTGVLVWTLADLDLGFTWMAAFYASLLLLAVAKPGPVERRVFRSRVLTRLGLVAYAVYLFHTGILRLYHYAFFDALPGLYDARTLAVTLLALGTVFLLCGLSWRMLEKPLIRRARERYRYGGSAPPVTPA